MCHRVRDKSASAYSVASKNGNYLFHYSPKNVHAAEDSQGPPHMEQHGVRQPVFMSGQLSNTSFAMIPN